MNRLPVTAKGDPRRVGPALAEVSARVKPCPLPVPSRPAELPLAAGAGLDTAATGPGTSPLPPHTSRTVPRLVTTAVATLLGAGAGLWVFGHSPLILLGVLLGFLFGRTIVGIAYSDKTGWKAPAWFPSAHWCLVLSLGGWAAVLGFWGFAHSTGFLRGEGASLLMVFYLLPVTAVCGLLGGPTASAAARAALKQIDAGKRPESDRWLARLALTLSRVMTIALLGFLVWLLVAINR